jgi:hypothetical protein
VTREDELDRDASRSEYNVTNPQAKSPISRLPCVRICPTREMLIAEHTYVQRIAGSWILTQAILKSVEMVVNGSESYDGANSDKFTMNLITGVRTATGRICFSGLHHLLLRPR